MVNCWILICLLSSIAPVRIDDRVFDCLREAMGIIQSVDPKSVISTATTRCGCCSRITYAHGVDSFDLLLLLLNYFFQMVNGPTQRAGGVLDLVTKKNSQYNFWQNNTDLSNVNVNQGNAGRSNHVLLGITFNVACGILFKSRVNWNAVSEALSRLNWRSIFRCPTMVQDFDMEVRRILERLVSMVTVRRRGEDAAWFAGDCRRAFELKKSAYHCWSRKRTAVN